MELVILVGLQGAGKSTFYRTVLAPTHSHVSKDNFASRYKADQRQATMIEAALSQGLSVAVDNTSPSPTVRAPLIEMGRRCGATIVGYYFESDMADCLRRNRQREGKARVPDIALQITRGQLQPPTLDEGFHQIYYVRMLAEGGFELSAEPPQTVI